MNTTPMKHQEEGGRRLAAAPEFYGLACEQGTGKTWMLLDDIERQYNSGRIKAALVIAPKGVHANWILREAPTHLSVPWVGHYYLSGSGVKRKRELDKLLEHDGDELAILAMNIDALNTKGGFDVAAKLLRRMPTMMIIDESQRIKNPATGRSKKAYVLGEMAVSRRIASGTMIANSPLDAFGQMEFLNSGLLGTTSHRAFVAEYAELLPATSPLVIAAMERSRARTAPQIVRRDTAGRAVYRNLEKLSAHMAPHIYRVTKEECLDLPAKVYTTHFFELEPKQRKIYEAVEENARYELEDGRIDIYSALTLINKLRQATSGFIIVEGEVLQLSEEPARLKAFKDLMEDVDGKVIIWASFNEEIKQICAALRKMGIEYVEYHGGTNDAERGRAIERFQNGSAQAFVGNPAAGGTGITLTAANTVIYYSCDYSLENRLQSEDRCHRIGTTKPVLYIDMAATNTIDVKIANALQSKQATALEVLNGI